MRHCLIVSIVTVLALTAGCAKKTVLPSLQSELDAKSAAFAEKADDELKSDFAEGVEFVRQSGVLETALKTGDKAPDFTLPKPDGSVIVLSDLLEKGPVILTWYRGGWCPYCNIQLRAYQAALPEIMEEGGQVVAISPEKPEKAAMTSESDALGFPVVSDAGNAVARQYGIVYQLPQAVLKHFEGRIDLAEYNGDTSNELPLAVTYVIDTDGVIRYAFIDADYKKRAEPSDLLEVLGDLSP